ncbi:hypothetical protein PMZ80_003212 [Knufia obscura]|uniref:Uncharacterized protein n=2 Tax=Knufia TaxID=430999 RepID=A0AAN8I3G6_9EURO|nr:hypothetical protein PMZ80_003212 [Knufia obscura]KAK5950329.1 hypothetical protein OHC33_008548 [Knufia fluminis]
MPAIPLAQNHMTDAHGQSASSGLSNRPGSVAAQSNSKRPKLSLQTTSLANTYGALTRGLAPNAAGAQAAFTPTTTNTLANTWDLSIRPSPISRTESPRHPPTRTQTPQQPYTLSLPFGVKSILKNSPLPPSQSSVSASPREPRKKTFFPQPKRVVFQRNLEDFIETTRYVARHSDLTSSSSEESSEEESHPDAPSLSPPEVESSGSQSSPPPSRKRKNRRDGGIYIETNMEQRQHNEEVTSANTPIKNRKRRRWQQTFVPGGTTENEAQSNPIQSEDDVVEGDCPLQAPSQAVEEIDAPQAPSSKQPSLTDDNRDHISTSTNRSSEASDARRNRTEAEPQSPSKEADNPLVGDDLTRRSPS